MATRSDLDAKFDQMKAAVRQAQADRPQDWDADYETYRQSMVQICDHDIGPIANMVDQARDLANQLLAGVVEPEPEPPPPPALRIPPAGFYPGQRYGNAPRHWGNLTIPSGEVLGVLVQVHGGGWMMGDPNVALHLEDTPAEHEAVLDYGELLHGPFFGLRQMASYAAARWHVIVWEPAYTFSSGNPEVCLGDVKASIHWLMNKLNDWGALQLPLVYAGHSAGGQLSLRAALDPTVPAPAAWLGMAAAGLTVHRLQDVQDAPGGFTPGSGTGWIFNTAWGNPANWAFYAPDGHLHDRAERAERFPLYVEQGNLNNHDDGSVNLRWARDFVAPAQAAGWDVRYHEQNGLDHFAIRWDQSPTTRNDMDAIWREL